MYRSNQVVQLSRRVSASCTKVSSIKRDIDLSSVSRQIATSSLSSQVQKRSETRAAASRPTQPSLRSFSHLAVSKIEQSSSQDKKTNRLLLALAGGLAVSAAVLSQAEESKAAENVDYNAVRQAIIKILDEDDNRGPTFVRLAWHASGTYDKNSKTGGSNGATMRFQPEAGYGANYGLGWARELLEPVKKEFPGISYADLWTLSAAVAIEYMGGPVIPWRPGRTDAPSRTACPPNGRLPDADKGNDQATAQHLRDIFYRMGFDDKEIVALAGAHALGRCHQDRSGYHGPWTRSPTTFSNQYFKELVETKWTPKKWDGPLQYEDPSGDLMMLPADLVLVQDPKFKPHVEYYANNEKAFFEDFARAFQKLEELGVNFKA